MTTWPLIIFGLLFLYLTRQKMTRELSKLINKFGGSASPADKQRTFIWLWSLVFLPGTIIHEVSHFLAAAFTGARTGKIEIFPEMPKKTLDEKTDKVGGTHRLGFVETQRLNPIRGFIVGIAPLIVGLGLLIWLSSLLQASYQLKTWLILIAEAYLFFTIANSLFPSWADVKQTLPLIIIGIIAGGILWMAGVQIKIGPESPIWEIMTSLKNALLISVGINLGIILILRFLCGARASGTTCNT